jgi:hypothetical protein
VVSTHTHTHTHTRSAWRRDLVIAVTCFCAGVEGENVRVQHEAQIRRHASHPSVPNGAMSCGDVDAVTCAHTRPPLPHGGAGGHTSPAPAALFRLEEASFSLARHGAYLSLSPLSPFSLSLLIPSLLPDMVPLSI